MNVAKFIAEALLNSGEIGYQGPKAPDSIINNVLMPVYFWAGVIAVGIIVYSGFLYVLSNGEPGKVKKAKDSVLYSVVGLVVVLLAFAITKIVAGSVQ